MFESGLCRKTVSILEALIWGSDGACIDLGMQSIYLAALAFCVGVVVLKVGAKWGLVALFRGFRKKTYKDTQPPLEKKIYKPEEQRTGIDLPKSPDGGPIRTMR